MVARGARGAHPGSPEPLLAGSRSNELRLVAMRSAEPRRDALFDAHALVRTIRGDFGQPGLRPEQRAALGEVDVLFVPVGGGPTINGVDAAALVHEVGPRLVVPMHYRTAAVNFLEPPDAFLDAVGAPVERLDTSEADVEPLLGTSGTGVVLLAPHLAETT
jgi:L-ascorbate metabolism protein UlaG (beta-lactamase superfamily)